MAVGEEHPVPVPHALLQHPLRDRPLPLPERQAEKLVADPAQLSLGLEHDDRVDSRRQHKDQRCRGRRIVVHDVKIERWGLDEAGPKVVQDEGADSEDDAVRAQEADQIEPLQLVALVLPLAWEGGLLRLRVLVPLLPLRSVLLEARRDVAQVRET
eukprot:623522-Rhodomonas_salina.2